MPLMDAQRDTIGTELVSLNEAARLAGRSEATVRRWAVEGRLRGVKRLGRVLIDRASLTALLAGCPYAAPTSA